jgi:hypothetical protein
MLARDKVLVEKWDEGDMELTRAIQYSPIRELRDLGYLNYLSTSFYVRWLMRLLGQRCRKTAAFRMTETREDRDNEVSVDKHFNITGINRARAVMQDARKVICWTP